MDASLHALIAGGLAEAPPSDSSAAGLVLAAARGAASLEAVLEGRAAEAADPDIAAPGAAAAAGVYLEGIDVEGFRGIGEPATLRLSPFPSLTLVIGRNGSGKSSFAEALELLLTGSNHRWEGRSEIWKEGWRNLHHPSARIGAAFIVEGRPGRLSVERTWEDGAGLAAGTTRVGGAGAGATLETLGWRGALAAYRPFLPHNELGAVWDEGPARLHDALAAILGLEEVTALQNALAAARLRREQQVKQATAALGAVRGLLEGLDDDRARVCLAATSGKAWRLDSVEAVLADGGTAVAPGDAATLLRDLAGLPSPDPDAVAAQCVRLRDAARHAAALHGTDAGRARSTASLLSVALDHLGRHPGTGCPVCGTAGVIDAEWGRRTRAEIEALRARAAEADAAHAALQRERQLALSLIGRMPAAALRAGDAGLDASALRDAWTAWAGLSGDPDPEELARHMEERIAPLAEATASVRGAAAAELARREDRWRPSAQQLAQWLEQARVAVRDAAALPALKSAESWVKAEDRRLRAERFAPIGRAVQENWIALRQDSSVSLGELRLEGSRTTRRLALDVSIDGAPGQALGVMSQGELNALALSLFLPRASLPESPFRFIVIDDPVQAMDPSKVDGLARVLERAAATHQVVVFTHDERLPAAARRLGIESTVVEVVRRESSAVELRESLSPVRRHIEDAFAVASSDHLPVPAGRVVPAFCRLALEAACSEAVMRRRLARGQTVADVEADLARATTLTGYMALALHDDGSRGNDVVSALNNRFGQWAIGLYQRCNRGAHIEDTGDLRFLCRETERLAEALTGMR